MNFLLEQNRLSFANSLKNLHADLETSILAISRLQYELLSSQNIIKSLTSDNNSLRATVKNLQLQLENRSSSHPAKSSSPSTIDLSPKKSSEARVPPQIEIPIPRPKSEPPIIIKEEPNAETIDNSETSQESAFNSPLLSLKIESELLSDDSEEDSNRPPIKRRNGFRQRNKNEENKNTTNDSKNKIQRSRAKHLWITYGRKIIDYSLANSKGGLKERIKTCSNLISKKGYSEVFLLRTHDTEKDKAFKKDFGRLAIQFIEREVENAFLSSNYRDELLAQKNKVCGWIKKLIQEE